MSVKVMARVWTHSQRKDGELLVMLALADFANDAGECWPALDVLAQKARLSKKQLCIVLTKLETAGEIMRRRSSGGRNKRTHYHIDLGSENSHQKTVLKGNGNQITVLFEDKNSPVEVTRIKPSRNRQEENRSKLSGDAETWPSPEALIKLYNDLAPDECPAVITLSEKRRKTAAKYLRAFPSRDFWEATFKQIARSPFLRGLRTGDGQRKFIAKFDWLLSNGKDGIENFVKVHDGNYVN